MLYALTISMKKKVEESIRKYQMLSKNNPVPVGFSGGKDSLTAILLLKELGYDVRPVIVDRGDILFNSRKIAENLYQHFEIEADILNLRDHYFLQTISPRSSEMIKMYLHKIDNIASDESLCTPCYNARTIALKEYTKKLGANSFVIGQHKTDMITSLLKCYWTEIYYYTFTKPRGIPYDGFRMKELIESSEIDINYLEKMVKEGRAATDDPPVEIIDDVKLVRPLEAVSESEIRDFVKKFNYPYESGNCSYREKEPRPFRLLVQFDLERRLKENPELEDLLYNFVLMGLNSDGTLKYRPRNLRDKLYPGFKPFQRKVGNI